jgi:hypothetical protein
MDDKYNTIQLGDCIEGMNSLPEGSIDLAFADPPFNIGYDYDVYHDKLESDRYVAWSRDWIGAAYRALKPNGTFWLAIGDEFAAELKIESQRVGFHCRSWVVWYYTFGVNCSMKFSRSHAHLFHFIKDPQAFTFRNGLPDKQTGEVEPTDRFNRIPSARQLVYNDKRANSKGRLADDTWIIRPGDASGILDVDPEGWSPTQIAVPSEHSEVHQHPACIYEVRRILLENLVELDRIRDRNIPELPVDRDASPEVRTANWHASSFSYPGEVRQATVEQQPGISQDFVPSESK